MKTKQHLMAVALRVGILTAALGGTVHAQALDGSSGVSMGGTGKISGAPHITTPNSVVSGTGFSWEFTAALQGFVVPAGQLTGLGTDGNPVSYEDLIPFKTSKLSVVTGAPGAAPTGDGTIIDGNGIETNGLSLLDSVTGEVVPLMVENGVLLVDGQAAGGAGAGSTLALDSSTSPTGSSVGQIAYNTNPDSGVPVGPVYWDGSSWQPLSGGAGSTPSVSLDSTTEPAGSSVGQIAYNTDASSGLPVGPVVWNGSEWETLCCDELESLALTSTTTPAGESVGQVAYNTDPSSGLPVGPVYWDGTEWQPFGGSAGGNDSLALTSATEPAGTSLGQVVYNTDASSGVPVGPVYWDGSSWQPLSGGAGSTPSVALDSATEPAGSSVGQIAYNTDASSGLPVGPVVWNGSEWETLCCDELESLALTSSTTPAGESVGQVAYNTDPSSGLPVGPVYWDGTEWQPFGGSAGGNDSLALTSATEPAGTSLGEIVYNTDASSGVPVGLVYWDGSQWQPLGTAGSTPNVALTSSTEPAGASEGQVVYNTDANSGLPVGLVVWDGTEWQSVGGDGGGGSGGEITPVPSQSIYAGGLKIYYGSADIPSGTLTTLGGASVSIPISTFKMDKTEVTYGHYRLVYQWALDNGYLFPGAAIAADLGVPTSTRNPGGAGLGADHPVVCVNFYDCLLWANARSEMEGLLPVYYMSGTFNDANVYRSGELPGFVTNPSANGYRLPSQAEWEWAARGGNMAANIYPWGSTSINNGMANYGQYNGTRTVSVASLPEGVNPWGLFDMSGNMWEWTISFSGLNPIFCGGSWAQAAGDVRVSTSAANINPGHRHSHIGFRLIRN